MRLLKRTIAASARRDGPAPTGADERVALARSLAERAASSVDVPFGVCARGRGFAIRLVMSDLATAETILARLAVSQDTQA